MLIENKKDHMVYSCKCGAKFTRKDNLDRHRKNVCALSINNNNVIINPAINVTVVSIDKEEINDLSVIEWGEIFNSSRNIFIEILKKVNCQKHYNIYYNNLESDYGFVYINNQIKKDDITNILNIFIDNRINDIRKIIESWRLLLDKKSVEYLILTLDKLESNTKKRNKLITCLKLVLHFYSDEIGEKFKSINSNNEMIEI